MQLEWFITRRIAFSAKKSFSRFIIGITLVAVALSIATMIVSTAVTLGFMNDVKAKVYGFWGHIHITSYGFGNSFDERPISSQQEFLDSLRRVPGVEHIHTFANKAGIMRTEDQIEGIVLKGVGEDFDWTFFNSMLVDGDTLVRGPKASKSILISKTTADRLDLKVGDKVTMNFMERTPRVRRMDIVGIYNTGMVEYDKFFALVDMRQIVQLNRWEDDLIGGFEVFLRDDKELVEYANFIDAQIIPSDMVAYTVQEKYPNLFDWLSLISVNGFVVIILTVVVAVINMITCLLILILERTNMIGILKALGARSASIQRIFLYNGIYIFGVGGLLGNVIGLGICFLQDHFQFITLPEESYLLAVAPIYIDWWAVLGINVLALTVSAIVLLIPTRLVARISPVKAIRFD